MSTKIQLEETISTSFVCDCEDWMRKVCAGEEYYKEHEGKRYCVLHYPGKEKAELFRSALKKKLEAGDFAFCGVHFPETADFQGIQFNAPADFGSAVFNADAIFMIAGFHEPANFHSVRFQKKARFNDAKFVEDVRFDSAEFSEIATFGGTTFGKNASFTRASFDGLANFRSSTFKGHADFNAVSFNKPAIFNGTTFEAHAHFGQTSFNGDANFRKAKFTLNADFSFATFASYIRFEGAKNKDVFGEHSYLNLQNSYIDKPERVTFHTLTLKPYWFVNADPRKFNLIHIKWADFCQQHLEHLESLVESSPHTLLSNSYRQLSVNLEENHHYEKAGEFRYISMDLKRLEWWQGRRIRELPVLLLLYWLVSGYGEKITRAALVLVLIWAVFASIYTRTGFERKTTQNNNAQATVEVREDEKGKPLPFWRALTYSLGAMSLQKPDPKPLTNKAQIAVISETILGPLQVALLALAIRRRFMR